MIKTVYFDLGNVLLFFSPQKMFRQLASCTGLKPSFIRKRFYETDLRERYEKGLIDTHTLYATFHNLAPKPFTIEEFELAFSDIFTPNQPVWEIVRALKEQKIRLILLSNTSPSHYEFAAARYPLHLFDHKILSYEIGAWKPDSKIFQEALLHAQCPLNECLYTDDILNFIESAQKEGLPATQYKTASLLKKELSKHGLTFTRKSLPNPL